MKRRIVSIICIMFLLFTITSPISGSIFSYAEEQGLSDEQKAALAVSTYYNYRKGWFVGSSAGTVALVKSYIDDFFTSSANTTGIDSYSDFASTISTDNSSGHWKVTITNEGIVFLDHLCKWLLGKDKFPNLYSGGSWGANDKTDDNLYQGYIADYGSLWYTVTGYNMSAGTSYKVSKSAVKLGTPVRNFTSDFLWQQYKQQNPNNDLTTNAFQSQTTVSYSIQFTADFTWSSNLYRGWVSGYGNADRYMPLFCFGWRDAAGSDYLAEFAGTAILSKRSGQLTGNPALLHIVQSSNPPLYAAGWITYDATQDCYYVYPKKKFDSLPSNSTSASTNLLTDGFNKNDLGIEDGQGQADPNAEPKTFTPKYTSDDGDTYNYYNTNDNSTVNNFYNNYIDNYTYNTNNDYSKTIIYEGSSGIDPDPDEPETPGGTTPPWDNSSGAGTLTPDGNGGYNFNLPDLTIPDLNIDWNLRGLSEKFPFSIPWDLMAFFTVLNAEPETPAIEAQIDLGIVDWDIDWDLHDFDTLAALLRNLEFIGFCLALILITRSIIKG